MARFDTHVTLSPQFQRAIRVDLDWGKEAALKGFLCQASSANTLVAMAGHVANGHQSAFTWTGPYGGGKSSLALVLATLLGGDPQLRRVAREVLGEKLVAKISTAFCIPASSRNAKKWHVVRVAGSRNDTVAEIIKALGEADIPRIGKRLGDKPDAARVIKVINDLAFQTEYSGMLLVIDELGKLLEHIAGCGGDIHFFQELAEVASRSQGRLIVVGILHQAFEQYAVRLGREAQDEWAKIQGRFVDIPVLAAVDEVIELTGKAIKTSKRHPETKSGAQQIADAILRNRPSSSKGIADHLDQCWPLHPVTAALLGPVSRRRFSQNERSTFAFLGSSEPLGFREFLATTEDSGYVTYEPARYWDYLRTNLEPSILASPDGHRWAQAADAVGRCDSRGDMLRRRLMRSIALIDLFRNGSGLLATFEVLATCVPGASESQIRTALKDLVDWSVAVFRKHIGAYGVFEGSDFDIDAAVQRQLGQSSGLDAGRLAKLAPLQPILPKRHYHASGALRWFESMLATTDTLDSVIDGFNASGGAAGRFVLVIPDDQHSDRKRRMLCKEASNRRSDYPMVIGFPPNSDALRSFGRELVALEALWASHPELTGDAVARKELQARIVAVSAKLEDELTRARENAEWFVDGEIHHINGSRDLHSLASHLCDRTFKSAPSIHSELVNRPTVSSNAQAAVNLLAAALAAHPTHFAFGIEGYTAERGLYDTVFLSTGLHQERGKNNWEFVRPSKTDPSAECVPLWRAADKLLDGATRIVPLRDLYDVWMRPPFGLSEGLVGLIGLAYILSSRSHMALYQEGVYQPDLSPIFAHEAIRDPSVIGLRRIVATSEQAKLLTKLALVVRAEIGQECEPEPLAIGRALVKFVYSLPHWARRTAQVSDEAVKLRTALLGASDPHKLVLVDLPNLASEASESDIGEHIAEQLRALRGAYPQMLSGIRTKFLRSLGARDVSPAALNARAETVKGLTGDLRVEGLAVQLSQYDGTEESFEGIVGLAANKPSRDWTDLDVTSATLALADLALKFRSAEVLAAVGNRAPSRFAFGLVVGTGETGTAAMRAVDVGKDEMSPVERMAKEVLRVVQNSGQDPRLALAALARAGADLIDTIPESQV